VLAQPRSARLLAGRLKNLLGGTTLVVHHDRFHHTLRRAGVPAVLARYHWSHSLALDGERVRAMAWQRPRAWPWFIHAAEGTDAAAAGEFARLARLGALQPNTVLVHGIALSAREQTALVASGAGLVWCPSSNLFLYGTTADVRGLAAAGRVALGTDARLSGAGDLLDELRAAAATGQLPAPVLFDLVTERATRLLRTPDRGHLRLGARADLFLLPGGADPYTALLEAKRADLGLVVCGGRPVIGDPDFAPAFAIMGTATTPVRLDGRPKLLATALARAVVRAAVREPGLDVLSEP
jgi:cytosine/adenosine deaminase-related metal-dependent hydrolase